VAKLPSFPFYPGDWLRNDVAGCSLEAQGLWLRMMMVMHDAPIYGELSMNGEPMPDEFIAQKCGISRRIYRNNLKCLETFSVINRKENGVIYSGRMVRDENKRQQNAKRQRDFYENHKGEPNAKPNAPPNGASSSSSSSSVPKEKKKKEERPSTAPFNLSAHPARIPDPFPINAEMSIWLAEELPGLENPKDAHASFVEHFTNKTGAKALKINWLLTWQKGMRNAKKWQDEDKEKYKPNGHQKLRSVEDIDREQAEHAAAAKPNAADFVRGMQRPGQTN